MTVEEANLQVKKCKDNVESAEHSLASAARTVGSSACSAAAASVNRSLFSLIGIGFGVFLWMIQHPFYGTLVIIVSGIILYNWHHSASEKAGAVYTASKSLNDSIRHATNRNDNDN